MRFEMSFDDGHDLDFKVLEMAKGLAVRPMFYIPWTNRGYRGEGGLTDDEVTKLSLSSEIGFHSYSHPRDIKELETVIVEHEVVGGKGELEQLIGRSIRSFCYPRGKYDYRTVQAVRCSYTEARTTKIGAITQDFDPAMKPTTVHIYPGKPDYDGLSWSEYARKKFGEAQALGDGGYFHIWGHSWELEKFDLWDEFGDFVKFLKHSHAYAGTHV